MPRKRRWVLAMLCAAALAAVAVFRESKHRRRPLDELKPFAHWVFEPDAVTGKKVSEKSGKLPGLMLGNPKILPGEPTPRIEFSGPADGVQILDKVTPDEPFLPKTAFTIATWVRIDQPTEWGGIFGCLQDNGPHERGFLLGFNKSKFLFGLTTATTGKMTYLESAVSYELGSWYHVTATYDGTTMKLFVNGRPDAESKAQSGPVLYAETAPLIIGRYCDNDEDFPMQGAVREVLWCNHAATAEAIASHFKANEKLAAVRQSTEGPKFIVEPYLQFATKSTMIVMCETNVPTTGLLEFGDTFPPVRKIESKLDTMHEITIQGLNPKTKYFYRMTCTDAEGKKIVGKPLTFFTAVEPTDAYSFTVIGDTQKNPAITGKVAKLMWERRPNFVLHMGDVVDNGPDKKEWTDELFRPCQELFGRVPVFPCIGNHEKNHAHYYKYFSLPKPEYYYSFTYGNAEFFILDTNKMMFPGSEQVVWLEKALAASTAKWKICFHHHPCWSSDADDYGNTEQKNSTYGDIRARFLIPIYERHKVDIVMNGHVHAYERTWPIRNGKVDLKEGTVYLTSGGGGGKLEPVEPTPSFFKNQGRVDYHFGYFNVFGGTLEAKFFDHEGRLFDTFNLKKD